MDLDEDETIAIPLRPPLQNSSSPRDQEPLIDELAKLQQWQEERMQRKLRGEYESAVTHLAELVRVPVRSICLNLTKALQINENTERSARLVAIRVEGTKRTRLAFLKALVHPYLHPSSPQGTYPFSQSNPSFAPPTPSTFGGILQTARHASSQLMRTDVFASVEPRLERSRDVFSREGDLDLVLRAREKGWLFAKTSTEVGNGEGTAVCSFMPPHYQLLTFTTGHDSSAQERLWWWRDT
jgi:outer membrane protein insertion porin family